MKPAVQSLIGLLITSFAAACYVFALPVYAYQPPTYTTAFLTDYHHIQTYGGTCPFSGYGTFFVTVDATSSTSYLFYSNPDFNCLGFPSNVADVSGYWYTPQDGDIFQAGGDGQYSNVFVWRSGIGLIPFNATTTTRIVSLEPVAGTTTPSGAPVAFRLHIYINPADMGVLNLFGVQYELDLVDQNTLNHFSNPQEFDLFFNATTSGDVWLSTTTPLTDGNYAVTGSIHHSLAFGVVQNPLKNLGQTNQFIVGTSTYLGTQNQNLTKTLETEMTTRSATSTLSLLSHCLPFPGYFDALDCATSLLVPDTSTMKDTLVSFRDGFLSRWPWGYATHFVVLLTGFGTTTLPTLDFNPVNCAAWTNAGKTCPYPPALAGIGLHLDPWQVGATNSPLMSTTDYQGNNFVTAITPLWNGFWITLTFVTALFMLLKLNIHFSGGHVKHDSEAT